jgi:hypothetical protein
MSSVRTPRGIIPIVPLKGRGATSNRAPRFDAWDRQIDGEFVDGALGDEPAPDPRTHVTETTARTIISRNQSPDVPFDQSVNPYQGCEHEMRTTRRAPSP